MAWPRPLNVCFDSLSRRNFVPNSCPLLAFLLSAAHLSQILRPSGLLSQASLARLVRAKGFDLPFNATDPD